MTRLLTRCACASVLLAVVAAAAAGADDSFRPVVVAGPTESGVRLEVFDRRGRLCGRVRGGRLGLESEEECDRPSGAVHAPFVGSTSYGEGGSFSMWGVVAREVSAVEVVFARGDRVRVATEEGAAYRGRFAGVGRFFLAAAGPRRGRSLRRPLYLRQLGPDGTLLAVEDLGSEHRVGRSVTLARGRQGRVRWRLSAGAQRALEPLPGDEERFARTTCVSLAGSGGGFGHCFDPGRRREFVSATFGQSCDGLGTTLIEVPPPRTRLVAVLGTGRRVRPLRYRLPRHLGGDRVTVALLGRRTAIRRLEQVDRRGRRLRSLRIGLAPATLGCVGDEGSSLFGFFGEDGRRRPPAGARPALRVEDRGGELCLSFEGARPTAGDCDKPPVSAYEARILALRLPGSTFVGGVLPMDAATVDLELDGRDFVSAGATNAGAYEGQWAGKVRFVTTRVPGRRAVTAVRLRDRQGRRIATIEGPDTPPFEIRPSTLLRGARGLRLSAGVAARSFQGPRQLCLSISGATSTAECVPGFTERPLQVTVSCNPRRMVVWGTVPRAIRMLRLATDRGVRRGRLRAVPRRFRIDSRVALVAIPGGANPRELILIGPRHRTKRVRVPLPSARRQCGYTGSLATGNPFARR